MDYALKLFCSIFHSHYSFLLSYFLNKLDIFANILKSFKNVFK